MATLGKPSCPEQALVPRRHSQYEGVCTEPLQFHRFRLMIAILLTMVAILRRMIAT